MDHNTNPVVSFSCGEVEEDGNISTSTFPCCKSEFDYGCPSASSVDNVDETSTVVAHEASVEEDSPEQSVGSSQDEAEEASVDCNKDPCTYCGQNPCDWVRFEVEICEECEQLVEENRSNKEVRFHAYRLYTRLRHGVLRKFDRRPLPICVRGEIMDNWPERSRNYVGFQAALRDVADT